MQIFDTASAVLMAGLDVTLHRQNVLGSNIANLDTPGFTPSDVSFQAALKDATAAHQGMGPAVSHPRHLGPASGNFGSIATYERADTAPGLDGNSVDLDAQMGRISQNSILYHATTRAVSRKLAMLKYAASEGGI